MGERVHTRTDVNTFQIYTLKGKKDQFENYDLEESLPYLMSSCTDFEEEETILQTMGHSMGVEVDHTPKCHCKIVGEGIEYTWAQSKNYFCNILLDKKRGKENFKACVRQCLSQELLNTNLIQRFSK